MIQVFLGGEGPNELGRPGEYPGVIEAVLLRIRQEGWAVVGTCCWKNITKLAAKGPTPREERNVRGLAYEAKRAGASILAFVRDADGSERRTVEIGAAIERIATEFHGLETIGGTAVPVLEGWILAMMGVNGTEDLRKQAAQSKLEKSGIPPKSTQAMVAIVNKANFSQLPKDATTLRTWVDRGTQVLTSSSVKP